MELMDKQKTIAMLEEMKVKDPFDRYMKQNIGLDWAIDAIQTAPIIQLCDDTISRQQAIDALESIGSLDTEADKKYARSVFEALPSAQPKRTEKRTETHSCDLISRADVEQTVEDNILCYTHSDRPIDQDPDTECHMAIRTALRMLRKDLRKLPSAQPQITLCAECIHWKHSDVRKNYCEVFDWMNTADDFCSFAERRTDGVDNVPV